MNPCRNRRFRIQHRFADSKTISSKRPPAKAENSKPKTAAGVTQNELGI
jgi:hypothetical protein